MKLRKKRSKEGTNEKKKENLERRDGKQNQGKKRRDEGKLKNAWKTKG